MSIPSIASRSSAACGYDYFQSESIFTGKAADYTFGRPGYAPEAVAMITEKLLHPGGAVADVGAGTGILAREFIRRGIDTYCVEPNADMRAQAEAALGGNAYFRMISAPAEHTTLPDGSMALIAAASAFHWFDVDAFSAECARVLEPGGQVCILLNVRDYTDEFTKRQHELCERYCHGFTSLKHGLIKTERAAARFFGAGMRRAEWAFPLTYTHEKFIRRSLSSSYAPRHNQAEYDAYVTGLNALMDEMGMGEEFVLPNLTIMFYGRPRTFN